MLWTQTIGTHLCAVLSGFSCFWLCATPWSIGCQAPLFTGFSMQDYWSGLPCPPPGNLPNPGIKPASLKFSALAVWFFTSGTNSKDWMLWTQRIGNLLSLSKILCLFNLYVEYIMWNAGLDEEQAGNKVIGRNINNLRYADDTTLMAESKEELKSFLLKVKEESEKTGLKLNIQKTKIMASDPITSWQIDGETLATVTDFIFLGFKITADGDCSHEIKRSLLPGRKAVTKPKQHIKKQKHYFGDKGPSSQGYGFSSRHVRMWELDHKKSWAPKNWCFWTLVLEKTPESPLDCKEIQPVHSKGNQSCILTGGARMMLQYFSHLMGSSQLTGKYRCWERSKAGGEGADRKGQDGWMTSPTQWTWVCTSSGNGEGQGSLACCSPWDHKELDVTERLNNNRTSEVLQLLILKDKRCPKRQIWVRRVLVFTCTPMTLKFTSLVSSLLHTLTTVIHSLPNHLKAHLLF